MLIFSCKCTSHSSGRSWLHKGLYLASSLLESLKITCIYLAIPNPGPSAMEHKLSMFKCLMNNWNDMLRKREVFNCLTPSTKLSVLTQRSLNCGLKQFQRYQPFASWVSTKEENITSAGPSTSFWSSSSFLPHTPIGENW